ncbi:GlsB/YeaQ/YmgE family stress response membrane protein [Pedosphaera parvula]|uniref:Transglycosylase-associated protein n=1 Tax=Pedosphaera parvula (strain Ellin514) TaxID=320771 RepID=B9XB90_PEDPL|nr:GlsB/YeaQ/YmgE family stress response membrane protein [Pedosphaera parvula]EEF62775.1 Transglycosylase-associated protein [Pedosphaera parvula Ellin514]
MHILGTIIIGFIVGVIAKLLMPGRDPGGFVITTLLGIAGAFIAKYIGQALGWYREGQNAGFIASVIGAIILLAIYHLVRRGVRHDNVHGDSPKIR